MAMMSEFPVQEYDTGDNSDVIATDSQKNTVYILAKLHGVASPEEFGLLVTDHFLSTYPWVTKSRVEVSLHPWRRILVPGQVRHSCTYLLFVHMSTSCNEDQHELRR